MFLSLISLFRHGLLRPPVIQKHIHRNRHVYFVVFCSLSVISALFLSFFYSVMPLWWHLQAVKRILLIPDLMICLALLPICSKRSSE
jgi:uncharacterized membrane protein YqhA